MVYASSLEVLLITWTAQCRSWRLAIKTTIRRSFSIFYFAHENCSLYYWKVHELPGQLQHDCGLVVVLLASVLVTTTGYVLIVVVGTSSLFCCISGSIFTVLDDVFDVVGHDGNSRGRKQIRSIQMVPLKQLLVTLVLSLWAWLVVTTGSTGRFAGFTA
jgi:hypothetical protein